MNRYYHIDSIRGIAALFVVWMHVSEVFRSFLTEGSSDYWVYSIADTVDFGRIGVVAFFAVSGFVIPSSLKGERIIGLKVFLIKRFFRLYPVFWVSIPLAIFSTFYLWDKSVSLQQIIANITMMPSLFGYVPIEGLYWTLVIELFFYACCSVLFYLGILRYSSFFFISVSSLLVFIILKDVAALYISIMFWGAIYRHYVDKQRFSYDWVILIGLPIAVVIGLPLYGFYLYSKFGALDPVWIKFIASHSLGFLLFLVLAGFLKLTSSPFVFLGRISYSLYLFHPVIFYPFYWWAGRTSLEWVRDLPLIGWVVSMMILSVLFSYITYRLVEVPSIAYGNRKASLLYSSP